MGEWETTQYDPDNRPRRKDTRNHVDGIMVISKKNNVWVTGIHTGHHVGKLRVAMMVSQGENVDTPRVTMTFWLREEGLRETTLVEAHCRAQKMG